MKGFATHCFLIVVLNITCCAQMKVVERMPVIGNNVPATSNPTPQDNGISTTAAQ